MESTILVKNECPILVKNECPILVKNECPILVKNECETDTRYGIEPEKRSIMTHIRDGIIDLDKPSGPTSHQVSSWVKTILKVKKAGHSGTLDPAVTGILPIAVENSTKVLRTLLLAPKEYVGLMSLHGDVQDEKLNEVLEYFKGKIYQKPPLKSSVKRRLRIKTIYSLDLIERDGRYVLFRVACEAGTYIRKLCRDIGLILGTGAHMQELRRTKVGPLNESTIVALHDLKDAYEFYLEGDESELRRCILPVEYAVGHLKKIWIKDGAVDALCHGADLNAPGVCKLDDEIQLDDAVAAFTLKNELVAIGRSLRSSDEIMKMSSGKVVDSERVIMAPGTYPKKWHSK